MKPAKFPPVAGMEYDRGIRARRAGRVNRSGRVSRADRNERSSRVGVGGRSLVELLVELAAVEGLEKKETDLLLLTELETKEVEQLRLKLRE